MTGTGCDPDCDHDIKRVEIRPWDTGIDHLDRRFRTAVFECRYCDHWRVVAERTNARLTGFAGEEA